MPHDLAPSADHGPPFDPAAVPDTVVLTADRARLRLTWLDGETAELRAERLRATCRCAWCTRARLDGTFAASFDGVAIDRLTPIGGYAINVHFTDGHARGIYPWTYLRKLAVDPDTVMPVAAADAAQGLHRHDGSSA